MRMFKPMKCVDVDWKDCFNPNDKVYVELKRDGTRAILDYQKKNIWSERGIECSKKYPEILENLEFNDDTNVESCVLDGEIVYLDESGKSIFNKLLMRNTRDKFKVDILKKELPVRFIVFDILECNGFYEGLKEQPLSFRKKLLRDIIKENDYIMLAKNYQQNFKELVKEIEEKNLEGFIVKPKNSKYHEGKRRIWKKSKYKKEAVVEFTDYEEHSDCNGYTYTDGFHRVSVNGLGSEKGVEDIEKHGYCLIEIQYLRKNESGHYYQIAFKSFKEVEKYEN